MPGDLFDMTEEDGVAQQDPEAFGIDRSIMTSTLNPRTTTPSTTDNRDTAKPANAGHHHQGPSIRRIAMLGAATALAALGIGAIMQNGGTESLEVPATSSGFATQIREGATVQSSAAQGAAVEVPATRSGFATQIREGAAVQPSAPTVNQGPNFELPATWTEWSVITAPAAATGPTIPTNVR